MEAKKSEESPRDPDENPSDNELDKGFALK